MSWRDPPQAGESWRRRRSGKQETRHVIDRTFGDDVVYYYGDYRNHHEATCSEEEWKAWVSEAKRLERRP